MNQNIFKKISVVGLGYIGLPTAAMFASNGIEVVGVDINEKTVNTVNRGCIHIAEPDLDVMVEKVVKRGYLRATMSPEAADAFIIAVPTPFKGSDHTPDLSYIEAACQIIAPVIEKGNIIILESTSPVGATDTMARWLSIARPDLTFPQDSAELSDIRIAHCPERVLPGKIMHELIVNDRVIGGMTERCSKMAIDLYKVFVKGECVIASSTRAAEMAKLTENSFRDVNIAFANELSLICKKLDIDVWELIGLANRHPRVNVLQPGPGVGGHCIAVDPWFIISSAPEEADIIKAARRVNDKKPIWVISQVFEMIKEVMSSSQLSEGEVVVAIYGISFKPDIDDLRESPAVEIVKAISNSHSGPIMIIEPNINVLPEGLGHATLDNTNDITAHIHIMLVDHTHFRSMSRPQGKIVDTKGVWRT